MVIAVSPFNPQTAEHTQFACKNEPMRSPFLLQQPPSFSFAGQLRRGGGGKGEGGRGEKGRGGKGEGREGVKGRGRSTPCFPHPKATKSGLPATRQPPGHPARTPGAARPPRPCLEAGAAVLISGNPFKINVIVNGFPEKPSQDWYPQQKTTHPSGVVSKMGLWTPKIHTKSGHP